MPVSRRQRIVWIALAVAVVGLVFLAVASRSGSGPRRASHPEQATGPQSKREEQAAARAPPAPQARPVLVLGWVEQDGGLRIPEARVRDTAGRSTNSAHDGRFGLESRCGETVLVTASGFGQVEFKTPAECDRVWEVGAVRLSGSARILVDVRDAGGAPVPGVPVDWTRVRPPESALNTRRNRALADDDWCGRETTDNNGSAVLDGLPSGVRVAVRATVKDLPIVSRPLQLAAEETRTVVLSPTPVRHTLRIDSRLRGKPVSPVIVSRTDGSPETRWVRRIANDTGTVQLDLPPGAYMVAVSAAGRRRVSEAIVLDRDRRVDLSFQKMDVLRVHARFPDGRPAPRFHVALAAGAQVSGNRNSTIDVHMLFLPGHAVKGIDGVAYLPLPARESHGSADGSELVLLARAPGHAVTRKPFLWPAGKEEHEVTVELGPGTTLRGRIENLFAETMLRLYYRADPGGAQWAGDAAPLLDEEPAGSDGIVVLEGAGAGVYEVRARGPWGEIPITTVEVPVPSEVEFTGRFEPSTVVVRAKQPSGEVLLYPLHEGEGWTGEAYTGEGIPGTRDAATLVFSQLPPGRYVLDGAMSARHVWGASRAALEIELRPGEVKELEWEPPAPATRFTIRVTASDGDRSGLVAAVCPQEALPQWAANLTWATPDRDGYCVLLARPDEPAVLIVAALANEHETGAPAVPLTSVAYGGGALLEGVSVVVPPPASLVVRCPDAARAHVTVTTELGATMVRDRISLGLGERSPPLPAGRVDVVVEEVLPADSSRAPRVATAAVELRSGEDRTVTVKLASDSGK